MVVGSVPWLMSQHDREGIVYNNTMDGAGSGLKLRPHPPKKKNWEADLRGSLIFDTVVTEFAHPEYSLAPLVSALDDRLPPTVCSSTFAAKRADMIETVR